MKRVLIIVGVIVLILITGAVFIVHNRRAKVQSLQPVFNVPSQTTDSTTPAASYTAGNYSESIVTADGRKRTYILHIPTGYSASKSYPLVLVLHGGGSSPSVVETMTEFSPLADTKEFIVVYPEGASGVLPLPTWNAGDCCGYAQKNNVDDVAFIRELVAHLTSTQSINRAKVFITGMSNGAMMTNRLACEMADVFAAAAPVSGTLQMSTCNPARPIPILMVHGTADGPEPYLGGKGQVAATRNNTFIPVPQAFADWASRNGCLGQPATTVISPLVNDGITIDKLSYSNCAAPVILYRINGGLHYWPGGNPGQGQESANPTQAFNASGAIWDFFSTHSRK